jgi:hypothetical protein
MQFVERNGIKASIGLLAFALLASVGGWLWQTRDPFYGHLVKNQPFTSLSYAYHTFLWYNPQDSVHLAWARQGNFGYVKQIFAWEDIQPIEGEWIWTRADEIVDLAEDNEVRIVARLTNTPGWVHPGMDIDNNGIHDAPPDDFNQFAEYCGVVASRYQGRISAYQVWNEPNLSREWGGAEPNAADYVQLLAGCSAAIRLADPNAVIISAGLSPTGTHSELAHRDDLYLQEMYDADFQQYVDAVGVHAPGFSDVAYGPDDAERDGRGRWATFRRVEDMRLIMVRNGDAARQMAILEMGWTIADAEKHPDYAWFAVDEEKQREQLVKAHEFAAENWRPWVGLVTTIYLADPSWTEEDEELFFAVISSNMRQRPAFSGLQNMAKYCGDRIIPERDAGSPEAIGFVPTYPCY